MAKRSNRSSLLILLPLVVGILVTPVALRMASILALSGVDALTMLYPWVEVAKNPALGAAVDASFSVGQWVMYLQFPFYGLVMSWLWRTRGFVTAFAAVVFIHIGGIGFCYLLGYLHNSTPTKIF